MRFCKADLLVSGSLVCVVGGPSGFPLADCVHYSRGTDAGGCNSDARRAGFSEFVFLMFSTKIVGAAEAGAAMILLRCAVNIIPLVPGALLALTDRRKKKGSRECPAE